MSTPYLFQQCSDIYQANSLWRELIEHEILSIESEYSLKTKVLKKIKHFSYRHQYSDLVSNRLEAVKRVLDRSIPLWDRPIKDISLIISQSTLWTFEGAFLFRALIENMDVNNHNLSICREALLGRFQTNSTNDAITTGQTLPIVYGLTGRLYASTSNTLKLYHVLSEALPEYSFFYEIANLSGLFDLAKDDYKSKCLYTDKCLLQFDEITHQCLLKNVFLSPNEQLKWFNSTKFPFKQRVEFIQKYGSKLCDNFHTIFKETVFNELNKSIH